MATHFNQRGVLLVEDDFHDQELVRFAFQAAHITQPLAIVSNGQEAIKYLNGQGPYADRLTFPLPTLMLLDLWMPYVDGFEVIRWVRAKPGLKQLPITILTGSDSPHDLQLAYELGANAVLLKPLSLEKLSSTLKAATDFWFELCKLPTVMPFPAHST
ncbi:MAG TPA: response regulator [Candidatus Limnocylindrales bacterium]|jgi:CheY-like chemotaxis protein|nr:response regulator [Candidatus Limnocylindrales bacterium]